MCELRRVSARRSSSLPVTFTSTSSPGLWGRGCRVARLQVTHFRNFRFGGKWNTSEHVSSVHPTGKFPEKVENLKRWSRFPGWNFRTECRVPFTFLVVCTSSRSTVGHRDVPGFTTKWNNFLPIRNSTFAPTEISGLLS